MKMQHNKTEAQTPLCLFIDFSGQNFVRQADGSEVLQGYLK